VEMECAIQKLARTASLVLIVHFSVLAVHIHLRVKRGKINRKIGQCGDSVCSGTNGENCLTCVQDCGLCGMPFSFSFVYFILPLATTYFTDRKIDEKQCPGNPVCSGHGSCQPSGSCLCDDKWTGPQCDKGLPCFFFVFISH
jgi:hypothetical protein